MSKLKSCPASVVLSIRRELGWIVTSVKSLPPGDVAYELNKIDDRLAQCSASGFGGYSKSNRRSRRSRRASKRRY